MAGEVSHPTERRMNIGSDVLQGWMDVLLYITGSHMPYALLNNMTCTLCCIVFGCHSFPVPDCCALTMFELHSELQTAAKVTGQYLALTSQQDVHSWLTNSREPMVAIGGPEWEKTHFKKHCSASLYENLKWIHVSMCGKFVSHLSVWPSVSWPHESIEILLCND